MKKRSIIFGGYDTATNGWTLTAWKLSDPAQKTNYIAKPGGDGSWDLSTVLTDGIPRYSDRTFTATLECSEGTRAEREVLISSMVNQLDGLEWRIIPPDHPAHYLTGRIHVAVNYSDLAHAQVTVTGTCDPWLYNVDETIINLELESTEQTVEIRNAGRLVMVPTLTVDGSARLVYGTASINLTSDGDYEWPTLLLTPGAHTLKYSGTGSLVIKYREAVLR